MKVHYGTSKAYLKDEPLPDGSYVGTNKHTSEPVHLRWDEAKEEWVEVCVRTFTYEFDGSFHEVGPRPICACMAVVK